MLRKRPEITLAACRQVLATLHRRQVQPDGKVRYWGLVTRASETRPRWLRVVTLDDGVAIHNAFFDRGFREHAMKLHYYPETDSLYIELSPQVSAETREIAAGLNVDVDADGQVVGIDIDHASRSVDLATLPLAAA